MKMMDWFRQQVNDRGGGNYQTLINQALREYILGHQVNLEIIQTRSSS
jgi:uncharacterized protein (DUF4415 family)